jgi:excisionase family DNA binding protein
MINGEQILIDKKTSARLLSVSLRTIDNLIARGELQVRRVGRRVLIPRRVLDNFSRRDHRMPLVPKSRPSNIPSQEGASDNATE